jgi:amino acid efflux transporter
MTGLRRVLRWPEGAALTVAAVLGSGVLYLPALTAELAGPGAILAWAAMGLAIVPLALTLAHLSVRSPDAGGVAAFARDAFGPAAGNAAGWLFLGTVPVGAPVAGLIGMGYVSALVPLRPAEAALGAWGLLAVSLYLNGRGVDLSGRTAAAVVAAIALVMVAGVAAGAGHVRAAAFHPFLPHGIVPLGLDAALLFWAFVGWESIAHYAEEFVEPRELRLSVLVAVVLIDLLYLAVVAVTIGTRAYGGAESADSLAVLMGLGLGSVGRVLTAVLALLVSYGTVHAYAGGFARLVYAEARAGDFPAFFAHLHPRHATPTRVLAALLVVFSLVLGLYAWRPLPLSALIAWPSAIFIALYLLAMAAGLRLLPGTVQRLEAAVGFLVSLAALPFLGWTALYPVGISMASLIWWRLRTRRRPDAPPAAVKAAGASSDEVGRG